MPLRLLYNYAMSLQVIQGLPFVHPSEVSLLNRICSLGTYYIQLREFVTQQTSSTCALLNLPSRLAYGRANFLHFSILSMAVLHCTVGVALYVCVGARGNPARVQC